MADTSVSGIFYTLDIPEEAISFYRAGKAAAADQDYNQAIEKFSQALEFSETPTLFRARVLDQRGTSAWLLNHYEQARADFLTALEICNDPILSARLQARLGDVADSSGDYEAATAAYTEAMRMGMEVNDVLAIGRAQRGLGVVNRRQGNTEKALSHLTQALAAFRQAADPQEQIRVLTSIGRTRQARGEYQNAISALTEALNIAKAMKDRWRTALALNDIGEAYQALYDLDTALTFHTQALELVIDAGANMIRPDVLRNMGVDHIELGRLDTGMDFLLKALEQARSVGNREQEALTLYDMARAYLQQDDSDAAERIVSDLNALAENLNVDRYRALAAFMRGELLFAQGSRTAAAAELNIAVLDAQTALDRGMLWKLHAAMSHIVDDEAIASIHAQIAADFIQQTAEPLQDPHLKESFINAAPVTAVLVAAGIDPDKLLGKK
ncbi:MAG: tetratricopeptide repeat protein [Candidatus Promineifilaceae bacterium]